MRLVGLMGPTFEDDRDADAKPRPHRVDRHPARGPGPVGPRRSHRATPGAARRHRAGGRGRTSQRTDRGITGAFARTPPANGGTAGAPHPDPVSYTHLRAHETDSYLVC